MSSEVERGLTAIGLLQQSAGSVSFPLEQSCCYLTSICSRYKRARQPVVMAPKNLSSKPSSLQTIAPSRTPERHTKKARRKRSEEFRAECVVFVLSFYFFLLHAALRAMAAPLLPKRQRYCFINMTVSCPDGMAGMGRASLSPRNVPSV